MLIDVVIDTNVFRHAHNPEHPEFEHSKAVALRMMGCETYLCMDEAGLIAGEYEQQLTFDSSLGAALLVHLTDVGRIRHLPITVEEGSRRIIQQNLKDPRDRTFLKVAMNSKEHVLLSHDNHAYGGRFRKLINSRLGVEVVKASECVGRL